MDRDTPRTAKEAGILQPPMTTLYKNTMLYHELKTWLCPLRECHRRFPTKEETQQNLDIEHQSPIDVYPQCLIKKYRLFDLLSLREGRLRLYRVWASKSGSLLTQRRRIRDIYMAYNSDQVTGSETERGNRPRLKDKSKRRDRCKITAIGDTSLQTKNSLLFGGASTDRVPCKCS